MKEIKLQFGKVRGFQTRQLQENLGEVVLPLEGKLQGIPLKVDTMYLFMHKMSGKPESQRQEEGTHLKTRKFLFGS